MQTKLTLRIDEELIERARSHARQSGKSVSQLVSDYLELLPKPGPSSRAGIPFLYNLARR
jgi:Family of unknown function (DUF6364)